MRRVGLLGPRTHTDLLKAHGHVGEGKGSGRRCEARGGGFDPCAAGLELGGGGLGEDILPSLWWGGWMEVGLKGVGCDDEGVCRER